MIRYSWLGALSQRLCLAEGTKPYIYIYGEGGATCPDGGRLCKFFFGLPEVATYSSLDSIVASRKYVKKCNRKPLLGAIWCKKNQKKNRIFSMIFSVFSMIYIYLYTWYTYTYIFFQEYRKNIHIHIYIYIYIFAEDRLYTGKNSQKSAL